MGDTSSPSGQSIHLDDFDAVIFDLGGVLLPLFPSRTVEQFSAIFGSDASTAYTQTKQTALFDEFERGEISAKLFRHRLCETFGKTVNDTLLDDAWNAMLGFFPEAHLDFLLRLKEKKRTFVLSNTNEIHIARFIEDFDAMHGRRQLSFAAYFEAVHYSHDLKMRKPEGRIFERLLDTHGLSAQRTLFIDDNLANMEAALSIGLKALHHVTNAPLIPRFEGQTSP